MLRVKMDAMPIGTIWDSESFDATDHTVLVIGYRKPDSTVPTTIPPLTPEQIAKIEVPDHLKEPLAKHMRSTVYGK